MDAENLFFIYFITTVIITRIFLYFNRISSPKIKNFKLHHYIYGIILILISLLTKNLLIYSIGIGLFIDELLLLIRYGNNFHWKEFNSSYSKIGLAFIIVVVYFLREYFILIFNYFSL